jgi:predicted ATPase
MKELQGPDAGELLRRDGSNVASVVSRLSQDQPKVIERIKDYLQRIVPGIRDFNRVSLGPRETIEFRQEVKGAKNPWRFFAASMSDGTLRAIGALVAVQQLSDRKIPVTLVGIEEPETALHPAAAGVLMDALREAATHTQVVVTSHSPDLLDELDLDRDTLLVVESKEGMTQIAGPDDASRSAIKEHLYSAGELLRMAQLQPDERDLDRQRQLSLFDTEEEA